MSPIKNSSLYFIIKWQSLSILKHATANEKELFRKVEITFNKVKKQQLDIEFNQICSLNKKRGGLVGLVGLVVHNDTVK